MSESAEHLTNRQYTEQEHFIEACAAADIPPTKRQASKFRRKTGLAWYAHLKLARSRREED